jgi:hypothetical protein
VQIGQKTPAGRDSDGNPFHTTSKPLRRVGKYARQDENISKRVAENEQNRQARPKALLSRQELLAVLASAVRHHPKEYAAE